MFEKKHTYQKDTHMSITNQKGARRLVNIAKVALETGSGAREESLIWTLGLTGRVQD